MQVVEVRKAFWKIAWKYREEYPNALRMDNLPNHEKRITAKFCDLIRGRFPLIFIDYTTTDRNNLACHARRGYEGGFETFDPRNQSIQLNGRVSDHELELIKYLNNLTLHQRVADMIAEGRKDPDYRSDEHADFQRFNYMFAHVILHELAHMFITYIGKGDVETPEAMTANVSGDSKYARSEAGHSLEVFLYGGAMTFWRPENNKSEEVCSELSLGPMSAVLHVS